MKRVTYLLKDMSGSVRARMVLPEEESVVLEPWMIHRINQQGWSLEAWETTDSGVQIHGWADWKGVADEMAVVLGLLLNDEFDWSEEEADQVLAQAQAALDNYHVAEMEVSVARMDAEPERPTDENRPADHEEDEDGNET